MKLTIEQALKKGVEAHKSGKLKKANIYYKKIIKLQPNHPDANHNKGVLSVGLGEVQEALPFFKKALEANPSIAQFWLSYISALIKLSRISDAKAVFEQAKSKGAKGDGFDKIKKHFFELEKGKEVKAAYKKSSEPPKDQLQNLINKYTQGNFQEALDQSLKLLKEFPNSFNLYNIIATVNKELKKLDEAIEAYYKAISIKPDYADAYYNLGNALKDQDKLQKAIEAFRKAILIKPDYAEAYSNMGNALKDQGNLDKAIKAYKNALSIKPNFANAFNNMGIALKDKGNQEEAIKAFNDALSIKPNFFAAYYNLGIALQDQGKLYEAIKIYKKVLSLNPDYPQTYYNMGIVLQKQDKNYEAINAYNRAISLKPDYAEAYNNMGIVFQKQGNLDRAIKAYKNALSIKPNFANAFNNMGIALKDKGNQEEAIKAFNDALSIKPDYAEAYNNIGIALTGFIFKKPNRDIQNTISLLLDKKLYVRPKDITDAAISLLKLESSLQKQLKLVGSNNVIQNPLDIISDLDELSLLRKLMGSCPLPDLELEKLFKQLRASILENISSFKEETPKLLRFQSALALQCFNNEYIYSQSKNEEKAINSLDKKIRKLLSNNKQPSPSEILILASYKALYKYDWCKSLIINNQIQKVFTRTVEEPNQEEEIKLNIPTLKKISNKISSKVRKQYEDNPYPRWVNLSLKLESVTISEVVDELQIKLHFEKIKEAKNPDILIAGCGTGQHSITTAARFKSSKVLAIDLSLSSLAYAKRKTEELTIDNIEYLQADILDLGKLNKKFDIIESVGVLHHMDNPLKGWKALTNCLKPGGLMKIGLYSEIARQDIVKIKEEISQLGIQSISIEMKSFRDIIVKSDKKHHKLMTNFSDFYNLSELKDLLFHVQEHRFTIPLLKDNLNKLGLKFCGFESSIIVSQFRLTNKHKEDLFDLDKWQTFEEANQKAFTGMYQFWCQKEL